MKNAPGKWGILQQKRCNIMAGIQLKVNRNDLHSQFIFFFGTSGLFFKGRAFAIITAAFS